MKRIFLALMVAVAALAAVHVSPKQAAAAPVRPAIAQDVRGVAMGEYYFQDRNAAEQTVELMKEAGFNSLRLIIKWDSQSPLARWQIESICNAAQALVDHNMSTLVPNLLPRGDGWPNTDDGRTKFAGDVRQVNSLLLSKPAGCAMQGQPDGSVVPALNIEEMPVNEPNIRVFCDPGTDDDNLRHQICADWTVRLDHVVAGALAADSATYGVPLPMFGMALAARHNPLGFTDDYCQVRAKLGYTDDFPAAMGYHPYNLEGSDDPFSGIRTTPVYQAALRACFGRAMPVVYTESGFETTVPGDKGYTCFTPQSVLQVDPSSSAALVSQMYRLATKYDVQGIYNFQFYDEQCLNPGWQSGLYWQDGSAKPFLPGIQALMALAADPPDG